MISGSSPRVRGTGHVHSAPVIEGGIIPACAGNRAGLKPILGVEGDHPRVCGEQVPPQIEPLPKLGSSPRVRGIARLIAEGAPVTGIIPACAGNSFLQRGAQLGHKDHPRVCGEQSQPLKR